MSGKLDEIQKKRAFNIIDTIGIKKKVKLNLVGMDGNAFSLMGAFQAQAKREKWDSDEIEYVLKKCRACDYNNLLCVLVSYCDMNSEDVEIDRDEDDMPDVVYVNGVAYRKS